MRKIEQHVYTRAKRTLFQITEGYGTVAMSDGVGAVFAKEKIHPYCVYPQGSTERPRAVTLVHYPCGKMLLGQAVYVEKDFTGQRAAFFAHNYILPPHMVGDVLQDVGKLEHVQFLTEYNGGELAVASPLSEGFWPGEAIRKGLVSSHFLDCELLARCVTASVYTAKKTYIIALQAHIWPILSALYAHIPQEVKHRLGFCTYAREPVNKNGIHLIFLEPGAIKLSDPRLSQQFVFDLTSDTVPQSLPDKNHIVSFSVDKFFQEMKFLGLRVPHHEFSHIEDAWLDANLDTLTMAQFAEMPAAFIKRGKAGSKSELYVMLGILKSCAILPDTDLRYLLGSYTLSAEGRNRICKILQVAQSMQ